MTARLKVAITRRAQKHIEAAAQPRIGSRTKRATLVDVRRVTMSRVRYHLYYRIVGNTLEVLALWHTSRGVEPKV